LKSICRETYQKHPPVTISFEAKIAIFPAPPPRDALLVSTSLATLVLIRLSLPIPAFPPAALADQAAGASACGDGNGRAQRQVQAPNRRSLKTDSIAANDRPRHPTHASEVSYVDPLVTLLKAPLAAST